MFGRNESKDVDCEFRLVQDVSRHVIVCHVAVISLLILLLHFLQYCNCIECILYIKIV